MVAWCCSFGCHIAALASQINLYDVQDDDYNLKYDNAYNLYHNDVDGVNVGHGQSLDNINGC